MRVLLVEDDPMIGESIASGLKDAVYAADWVRNGEAAISATQTQQYDLILLDLGLPKKDGIEVLKSLRARKIAVPIVVITARDSVAQRVIGLDAGADDYVVKPFDMAELLARLRAVLRRKTDNADPLLTNGIVSLNQATKIASINGVEIGLSAREFAVLQALLFRPGAILSRSELEESVYSWGQEVESNAIEVLIYILRKKLGHEIIKNVRGLGWMVSKGS